MKVIVSQAVWEDDSIGVGPLSALSSGCDESLFMMTKTKTNTIFDAEIVGGEFFMMIS